MDKVNNWVSESTKDKIEEIVEAPLNPDLVTLLINSLYFNGNMSLMWTGRKQLHFIQKKKR